MGLRTVKFIMWLCAIACIATAIVYIFVFDAAAWWFIFIPIGLGIIAIWMASWAYRLYKSERNL